MSIPAMLLGAIGGSCAIAGLSWGRPLIVIGVILAVLALAYAASSWAYLRRPRLSYDPGSLLLHQGWGRTTALPIEIVECFFMGQAPSMVRGPDGKQAETATVVIRLAESAGEWQSGDMPPYLGQWCDGYIIVRGTWCEPIGMELLDRLNRNLAEAHRQQKQKTQAGP
jgi:hypothetical protein